MLTDWFHSSFLLSIAENECVVGAKHGSVQRQLNRNSLLESPEEKLGWWLRSRLRSSSSFQFRILASSSPTWSGSRDFVMQRYVLSHTEHNLHTTHSIFFSIFNCQRHYIVRGILELLEKTEIHTGQTGQLWSGSGNYCRPGMPDTDATAVSRVPRDSHFSLSNARFSFLSNKATIQGGQCVSGVGIAYPPVS